MLIDILLNLLGKLLLFFGDFQFDYLFFDDFIIDIEELVKFIGILKYLVVYFKKILI